MLLGLEKLGLFNTPVAGLVLARVSVCKVSDYCVFILIVAHVLIAPESIFNKGFSKTCRFYFIENMSVAGRLNHIFIQLEK